MKIFWLILAMALLAGCGDPNYVEPQPKRLPVVFEVHSSGQLPLR